MSCHFIVSSGLTLQVFEYLDFGSFEASLRLIGTGTSIGTDLHEGLARANFRKSKSEVVMSYSGLDQVDLGM